MTKTYRIDLIKQKLGKLISWVMLFTLFVVGFGTLRNIQTLSKSKLRIKEAEEKLQKLENENRELGFKRDVVNSMEFKESQIRDKLNMVKEGEIIVILPEIEIVKRFAESETTVETQPQEPNWKKWIDLFL